jgi:hypothetical protein
VEILREADRHMGEERKEVKRVKGIKVTSGSDNKQGKIMQQCESTEKDSYNARDASTLLSFTLMMEAIPSYRGFHIL